MISRDYKRSSIVRKKLIEQFGNPLNALIDCYQIINEQPKVFVWDARK